MTHVAKAIADVLHEAAETHHGCGGSRRRLSRPGVVVRGLAPRPPPSFRCCSGVKPVRSHLVHALVQLDRDHVEPGASGPWEDAYARGLSKRVAA
jgi:hypothetical protein